MLPIFKLENKKGLRLLVPLIEVRSLYVKGDTVQGYYLGILKLGPGYNELLILQNHKGEFILIEMSEGMRWPLSYREIGEYISIVCLTELMVEMDYDKCKYSIMGIRSATENPQNEVHHISLDKYIPPKYEPPEG